MKSHDNALILLCEKVATEVGDGVTAERLFAQKTAVASRIRSHVARTRLRQTLRWGFAAAAVFVIGLIFVYQPTPAPLAFSVGSVEESGTPGQWVSTPAGIDSVFTFVKSGSTFAIHPQTKARVAVANTEQVQLDLQNGSIEANISGNGHTRWMVVAGPYRITVLGTRFTVDWQETQQILNVHVLRGKVQVEGPDAAEHGVPLRAGTRFHATSRQQVVENASNTNGDAASDTTANGKENPPGTPAPTATEPVPGDALAPDEKTDPASQGSVATGRKPADHLGWLVWYAKGDFEKSLRVATRYGIDNLIEELDPVSLWKLQDAARITQNTALSAKILKRFQQRFPKNSNSRIANFLLGRIAMEKNHFSSAAQWFTTYISEDANGPLAEEAHGLLIVVYEKMGKNDLASSAALDYLKRYEGGAFSKIARAHTDQR